MSEIKLELSFPLDDEGFFRRECPLCFREFKILPEPGELVSWAQQEVESYLLTESEEASSEQDADMEEFTCPYCGQKATRRSWWTQEQLACVGVVAHNIVARMVNRELIRPLERMSHQFRSGPISLQFQGEEMEQHDPWMSPEPNDMQVFELPCCQRKIKIAEEWTSAVHCFLCGFPHSAPERR